MKRIELNKPKKQPTKKKTSKLYLIIVLVFYLTIDALLIDKIIVPSFAKYETKQQELKAEKEQQELLKRATIIVKLKENLNVSFYSDVKVSDLIEEINGNIVDDYKLDTSKLGQRKIKFEYINEENIKIPYAYTINVVDDIPPSIWLGSTYSITTKYDGKLLEDITCADNLDDNPKCEIIGKYNTQEAGEYKLTFKAIDSSGNVTTKEFTLKVKEPIESSGSSSSSTKKTRTNISDVIKKHKNGNTAIGIDVSSWQGDINFQKVKDAGVEFVFIRVGSTKGINGKYFVDKQFVDNIKGFNEVGIPVGIYFYSYANSDEAAINDAKWVLNQIKGYKIDLPIVYDWENWSIFDDYHQSFYSTSMNAKAFLDTMKKAGYDGLLYSSANYLNKVWFDIDYPVWLAHYTWETNYSGKYTYWQLCSNGKVPGISGSVDINVYYKNKEE